MNKIQDKIYNRCQKGREREEGRERERERKGGRWRERGREREGEREREREGGREGREGEEGSMYLYQVVLLQHNYQETIQPCHYNSLPTNHPQ